MATFEVKVLKIRAIEPIVGSDFIELAVIGDYRSVVRKDMYQPGNLVAYIPEAAIVPDWLLGTMGLTGKLAGKDKNRVKAAKFRGVLSQGIVYGDSYASDGDIQQARIADSNGMFWLWPEGTDITEHLGITKWEPEIPSSMSGEVYNAGTNLTVAYDVENVKNYPDMLQEGELVVYEEKAHGSLCGVAYLPSELHGPEHFRGKFLVFSKGLGSKGLCFKDNEANANNVYIRALNKFGVFSKLEAYFERAMQDPTWLGNIQPVFILGEVFGGGVQDLTYGGQLQYRVFDVCEGFRGNQSYFDYDQKKLFVEQDLGLELCPALYVGPHSRETMLEYTSGKEQISGKATHIREGIVMRPTLERKHSEIGRVMLKSVSEAYLLRKGENITEFS